VIDPIHDGHSFRVSTSAHPFPPSVTVADRPSDAARLRSAIDRHYDFVWRTLRYLGVPDGDADDGAQQVFCVLARRIGDVVPGTEMAFLFTTTTRVASEARRTARRRPPATGGDIDELVAAMPSAEELIDKRRASETLREVLGAMPMDLRVVFVLFEVEELTLVEIASLLEIKLGTATSRLRRARESFQSIVRRRQATLHHAAGAKR
jgi:RNA polymerase sigma-70 factor (ECF subfamily)